MTDYTPSISINVICPVVYFMKDNGPRNSVGILVALLWLCPVFALANEPPALVAVSKIVDLVSERGFTQISDIELSDDHDMYEVKALDSEQRKVEIEMDAYSGIIVEFDVED